MEATREKKIAFIESFGLYHLEKLAAAMVRDMGSDFLTDEQITMMAERQAEEAKVTNRFNIRNRAIASVK